MEQTDRRGPQTPVPSMHRFVYHASPSVRDTRGMRMQPVVGAPDLCPTAARQYAILADHAGTVVAADDLQVQLWGKGTPATAAYLALSARYLARTLAAQPGAARLVRLRRGRGYALTGAPAADSVRA